MKKTLLFLCLMYASLSFSQRLDRKIAQSSDLVVSINGNNILDLLDIHLFDNSSFGKKVLKSVNRKRKEKVNSVADIGFSLKNKSYYAFKQTDSINYHTFVMNLNSANDFEKVIGESKQKKIIKENGINILQNTKDITIWNDHTLLLVIADRSYSYFRKNKERLIKSHVWESKSFYKLKKHLAKKWTKEYALNSFNEKNKSIRNNSSYLKSINKKAIASLWIRSYSDLVNSALKKNMGFLLKKLANDKDTLKNKYTVESMVAHLFVNKNDITFSTEIFFNNALAKSLRKIYNSKLNKSFLNYIDTNKALSYLSFSINTSNLLKEYPNIIVNTYGSLFPKIKEEATVASDLINLFLDEEAIGKLVTGDAVLILNDLKEEEVNYTTYDYDKDFKKTENVKTKKELRPSFLFMLGTENKDLITKLSLLSAKHNTTTTYDKYFKVSSLKEKLPIDLFFTTKDGIFFVTNSEKQIKDIANDTFVSNVKKHQSLLRKNSSVAYIDINGILAKLPRNSNSYEVKLATKVMTTFKEVYITTGSVKGKRMKSELKINLKESSKNPLEVLLDLFEDIK
ncbi:DUF4836 family protein [Tenacibaculum maritimum]|uniref:DUF4836 family protein n=1 Tax=Tenacibaculum maritimum TaxID=107401 RepID=UPI001E369F0C|nr:DUF4836 family protein [Tenacibaculum maritimum]MCD9583906.1 DUF4836 family protein [Tenacibaculum maritimum]MCD9610756.1 DUF4836 family protein [Tenacibaculum maritimum]MCD9620536.1 DUF4836 family protein [Tenacibaculum maritimum]MCD9626617.1 DUF4836 family protein [Tenacibaculum maritimum]MCD9629331.1 DUF4836 family protein [Tenacibaculum maritimum]